MKATEYIRKHRDSLKYPDLLTKIIRDLRPLRLDEEATQKYFYDFLYPEYSYEQFYWNEKVYIKEAVFKQKEGEININDAVFIRSELIKVIENDHSFNYIYCNLAWLLNTTPHSFENTNPLNSIPDSKKIEDAITPIKHLNYFLSIPDTKRLKIYISFYRYSKDKLTETDKLIFFNTLEYILNHHTTKPIECLDLADTDFPLAETYKPLFIYCISLLIDTENLFSELLSEKGIPTENQIEADFIQLIEKPANNPNKNITTKEYKYDLEKITEIYDFCLGDVFKNISFHEFCLAVARADFSEIYTMKGTTKSKLKYIIYVTHFKSILEARNAEWYRATAKSIGFLRQHCSGANISSLDWKKQANAFI